MIVSAAIKYPNGEIVSGHDRHYKIISLQARYGMLSKQDAIQGFMNHRDEFLTRSEAKAEAIANGQISPDHEGELYSEDIWSESLTMSLECD